MIDAALGIQLHQKGPSGILPDGPFWCVNYYN